MDKKASMATVVGLLILAVGIVFLLPLTMDIGTLYANSEDSSACMISLSGGNKAKCEIKDAIITPSSLIIDGKEKDESKDAGSSKILSDLVLDCLQLGGGYNSRAFSSENYLSNELVCLECYTLELKDVEINNLALYMKDTKKTGSDKTYLEILTANPDHLKAYLEFGAGKKIVPGDNTQKLVSNTPYSIIFVGKKKGSATEFLGNLWDAVTLDFLSLFFENNDAYFAYVAESSRLGEICDRKVN